jgi:hypothetical protein
MPRLIDKLGFTSFLLITGAVACSGSGAKVGDDVATEEDSTSSAYSPPCTADSDCSSTRFCDNLTYGPWRCCSKRAVGSYCAEARECKSGVCTNYQCAAPPPPAPKCANPGARCTTDANCCTGFCNQDSGYGYGYGYGYGFSRCSAPQPNGSSCLADNHCTSGRCDQYECKATVTSCAAEAKACTTTADCCGTLFCNTDTYVNWTCTQPRPAGDACNVANECQSGSCVNYACQ